MSLSRVFINCHLRNGVKYLLQRPAYFTPGTVLRFFQNEVNPKLEAKLKLKDNVGDDYKIIYRAPYETWCKAAYIVAVFSSTVFPGIFSTLLFTQGLNFPLKLGEMEIVTAGWEIGVFAVGLAAMIAQLSLILFRYPFRIYRNKSDDDFILIYMSWLPWRIQKEVLKSGELKPFEKALFTWNDSIYEFKDRKAILFEEHFVRPVEFEAMLKKT